MLLYFHKTYWSKIVKAEEFLISIVCGFLGIVLEFILGIVMFVPLAFIHAYVFQIMWGWFIVPTFNLPMLPYLTCLGIMLLFFLLTGKGVHTYNEKKNEANTSTGLVLTAFLFAYTSPFFTLLFGFIIKSCLL